MRKKLQRFVFILLLILLPTQLGQHFWPEWAYVNGIRVDYFSPTLYFTDILILVLLVLEIPKIRLGKLGKLGVLGVFVAVNIYFSLSPAVSVHKWLKVGEMGFLVWYVARRAEFEAKWLLTPIFYEAVLAIWQFVNQATVGGFWYFLGERSFNAGTPGVAKATINGILVLRPYGTLPHPNVLMGFLVVSGLLILTHSPQISRKITALVLVLALMALVLTPSRGNLLKGWNLRQEFDAVAVREWSTSPLWGTGLGTSPLYVTSRQPTHNIYLLVLGEVGLLGVLGVLGILGKTKIGLPLGAVLFLGLFDHYFVTLQQGQLLVALVLGLSLRKVVKKNG